MSTVQPLARPVITTALDVQPAPATPADPTTSPPSETAPSLPNPQAVNLTDASRVTNPVAVRGPGLGAATLLRFGLERPAQPLAVFAPSEAVALWKDDSMFVAWSGQQLTHVPGAQAVYDKMGAWLRQGVPRTARDMLQKARDLAAEELRNTPDNVGPNKEHHITLVALLGLTAHSLARRPDSAHNAYPDYIPDGRSEPNAPWTRSGIDKCMHLVNQALFSYVTLFDSMLGTGVTAKAFVAALERMDDAGCGTAVGAAYEKSQGHTRSLLPNTMPPAPGETVVPYFARPTDLSLEEAVAYDASVRVGDQHEWYASWGPIAPLADFSSDQNPLAQIRSMTAHTGSVHDSGVNRDLTADRVGAWLGIQLFRNPKAVPDIPFDLGLQWTSRPYEPGFKGTFHSYFADESVMLARLGGWTGPQAGVDKDAHEAWARGVGPDEACKDLKRKLDEQVTRLAQTDRNALNLFYGNFSVRQLRMCVPFGEAQLEAPDSATHTSWAQAASVENIRKNVHLRLDAIKQAHDVRGAFDVIKQRARQERELGGFVGTCTALLGGGLQQVAGPQFEGGTAWLLAKEGGPACVVKNGILAAYRSSTHPQGGGRCLHDVLGLPTQDQQADGNGFIQAFERGRLRWTPGGAELLALPASA